MEVDTRFFVLLALLVFAGGAFILAVLGSLLRSLLRHERFTGKALVLFLGGVSVGIAATVLVHPREFSEDTHFRKWGVTFSYPYAESLGLSWKEAYRAILEDLGVRHLRIPVYWHLVEPVRGTFDFAAVDWQIAEARARGAKVTLAVGRKVPHWPECYVPSWAHALSEDEQQREILRMIEAVVSRYAHEKNIWAWQVENEPFLRFGECPEFDETFFAREVAFVRELDPSRPIVVTESGESLSWERAARYADILGINVYRITPRAGNGRETAYHANQISPWFYQQRAAHLERIFPGKKVIISELQAEPWLADAPFNEFTIEEQYRSMNPAFFRDTTRYAVRTGIGRIYLWGVEWWLWLKLHGYPEMWDEAKALFE